MTERKEAIDDQESKFFAAELRADTPEVDLHGLDIHDALQAADKAIDQAVQNEEEVVRITHGIGSGKLKMAVREHLANHPQVETWRPDAKEPNAKTLVLTR